MKVLLGLIGLLGMLMIIINVLILIGLSFVSSVILSNDPLSTRKLIITPNIYKYLKMFMIISFILIIFLFLLIIYMLYVTITKKIYMIIIIIFFLILLIILIIGISYIYKFIIEKDDDIINSIDKINIMKISIICFYLLLTAPQIIVIYINFINK